MRLGPEHLIDDALPLLASAVSNLAANARAQGCWMWHVGFRGRGRPVTGICWAIPCHARRFRPMLWGRWWHLDIIMTRISSPLSMCAFAGVRSFAAVNTLR